MEDEIWVDVVDYEGLYKVSSLGRIKALAKDVPMPRNGVRKQKERLLTPKLSTHYPMIILSKNGHSKMFKIHGLVCEAFIGKVPNGKIIDHINNIKQDNRAENLQIISQRENVLKSAKLLNLTSKYDGVCWSKYHSKWTAQIVFNGKNYNLGNYKTEIEASERYNNALEDIKNNVFRFVPYVSKNYYKTKYGFQVKIKGFCKTYKTEQEAISKLNELKNN